MAILLNSNRRVAFRGYFFGGYFVEDKFVSIKYADKHKCWVELRDGIQIMLFNIPPTKSLTQALSDYFNYYNYGQLVQPNFMKLSCDNCDGITLYADPNCIPFAAGNYGQLVCPHCSQPWLTYRYGE
jgi:hypothetical protein